VVHHAPVRLLASRRPILITALALGLVGCRGKSKAEPAPPPPPVAKTIDAGVVDAGDPRIAAAAALYKTHCALCHGPEAKGYAADNAPSLVNPSFLASADDAFFTRSIELGRPGTAMAGYGRDVGGPLDEQQIAGLIAMFRGGRPGPTRLDPAPTGGDAGRGAMIYADTCQKCHGNTTVRGTAPHLANPVFISLASDAFIAHAIRHGRPGTPMEAFPLSDQQLADVIAHLRTYAPSKVPTPPVTPPPPPPSDGPVVINPKGKPPTFTLRDGRFVPAAEVKRALDQKRRLVIIDARPSSDWTQLRIPGALSIPHYQHESLSRVPNDGTWVVAYCACPHHASGEVVDELRRRGYKNTAVLDEGILVWNQLKYPTTGTNAEALRGAAAPPPHVH
jgi:cytochrome c oxidase cbb3-type subunit III